MFSYSFVLLSTRYSPGVIEHEGLAVPNSFEGEGTDEGSIESLEYLQKIKYCELGI